MPAFSARSKVILLFGACVAFVSLLYAYALTRELPWLLGVVPDDAFYYLKVARNIAARRLASFDGVNPTNGYHPGWMAIVVGCAKLASTPTGLLRTCLATAFVFHVVTGSLLAVTLAKWTSRDWGWVGGSLWVLNPLAVNLAIQGMEASFYIFTLALAFWTYSSLLAPQLKADLLPPRPVDFAVFGLALSLCFYGRTEAVILDGFIVLAVAWDLRRSGWVPRVTAMAAGLCAGVIPWFLYSYATTGSWFQHSGAMKVLWAAHHRTHTAERISDAFMYLFDGWVTFPVLGLPGSRIAARAVIDAILTVGILWAFKRALLNPPTRRIAALGLVIVCGSLMTGAFYAVLSSETQYWYKAQPALVLSVVPYAVAGVAMGARPWRRAKLLVGAAAAVMAVSLVGRFATLGSYPWQRDVFTSQRTFEDLVPSAEPIGSFNAGIPAYFGEHAVINLDGLVNNTVYDYYRRHEFDRYLSDANIHYIADEKSSLERALLFTRQRIRLQVMATAPLTGWDSGPRYLWHIEEDTDRRER